LLHHLVARSHDAIGVFSDSARLYVLEQPSAAALP
jgi:hypothetical protein